MGLLLPPLTATVTIVLPEAPIADGFADTITVGVINGGALTVTELAPEALL